MEKLKDMNKMNLKKGQGVKIEEWIVYDQSEGKISTTTGTIQGYEDEYNGYIKVKLDCGNVLSFNSHELTCI
tara:strand:+ start:2837 stop:3052 length:216 start_codon:yes stop_codon:yes gene_type:complete